MKKSIFFLAASAIMFAMGSCTNDVLDNVQQVDSSLPQTRATASNDWTYAYVLSEGTWHVAPQRNFLVREVIFLLFYYFCPQIKTSV